MEDDEDNERFLDAETFNDEYEIASAAEFKVPSSSSPMLSPYMMILIAGIGVGIGFALGRRKQ
jgi:hypothetical protein